MKTLARLWKRPSYDGKRFTYYILYYDETGKRRQKALGHADARKAERQRAQFERELRMGAVEPGSMKLSEFLKDSLERTRGQVRRSTLVEVERAMMHFIRIVGNIDYLAVRHEHGERFVQASLDEGNAPATAAKKLRHIKRSFELAVNRGQLTENPLRKVRQPKSPEVHVHVYNNDECRRMIQCARESDIGKPFRWDLLIETALCTAMRRGELLNLI
jgi:site-specific recombinase XerD